MKLVGAVVKNPPASAGDARDMSSIPEQGRSPGVGNGDTLQNFWLKKLHGQGAWWATVYGVKLSLTEAT